MAAHRRSPPIMWRCGNSRFGIMKPSTSTKSGSVTKLITAFRIAENVAWWTFKLSITRGLAQPTLHPSARAMISSYRHSRAEADKSFESQTPGMCRSGLRTTTAATNGPARQPRPTSSTPATRANPKRLMAFSIVRGAAGLGIPDILGFGRLSAEPERKSDLRFRLSLAHSGGLPSEFSQIIQL